MEQQQEPDSWLSRTSRSITRLLSSSSSWTEPKQLRGPSKAAAAMQAAGKAAIPAAASAVSSFVTDVLSNDASALEWAAAATAEECVQDVEGDVTARTPSDLNMCSFTRKQQQQLLHTQQQQSAQQGSQASIRQLAAAQTGRSSSQLALRHPSSSSVNTGEGQQRRSSHEGRVRRSRTKKPVDSEHQQQQEQLQQQIATGKSLQEKWQAIWNISMEAQKLAKAAAATAAAVAEQQALLAAAEEEEEEQPPTGISTAAARRSSYGEAGVELMQLQLQQQPSDPWVRELAVWARECPELIQLQLQDNIPVPEAYQLPDSCWQDRHPLTATAEPAAQPVDAPAGACRSMHGVQAEQGGLASSATATEGGSSLQEELQQQEEVKEQQQQEEEKDKDLKPLEKPVDFVAELAQAVAAVKGLVETSADLASCGLSMRVDSTLQVLEEGWRVVQEVEWELEAYEKYAKWVSKRAQNVSLQAVLQQLEVLQCEARV